MEKELILIFVLAGLKPVKANEIIETEFPVRSTDFSLKQKLNPLEKSLFFFLKNYFPQKYKKMSVELNKTNNEESIYKIKNNLLLLINQHHMMYSTLMFSLGKRFYGEKNFAIRNGDEICISKYNTLSQLFELNYQEISKLKILD